MSSTHDLSSTPNHGGRPTRPSQEERRTRHGHAGVVIWLTGLPGAGKTTLAHAMERTLFDRGFNVMTLDGDVLRGGLNSDLGFSAEARRESVRRAAEVSALLAATGVAVIVALISPFEQDRRQARERVTAAGAGARFIEVFVDAPPETCEKRDPKGLYARARRGEVKNMTGVTSAYEVPSAPDVHVRTDQRSVDECAAAVLAQVLTA